ncbi:SRPBCC domain-containing protein [Catalinimonas sp. 4WD22]|uniref:SRPBCC domain-containing protein n=1 Tax=Catalinimonas locisalis TaxID=3133978 RepID=UPI0031018289
MLWLYISAAFLLIMLALSFTRFEIIHEIKIKASPEKVWAAIIDFEHYYKWNSQLKYLGGQIKPGGKLHLKLSAEGAEPYEFKPSITHWEINKKYGWIGRTGFPGIFDGEHFFELNDLGNGKTLLTNREEYRGVLSMLMKQLPMMKHAPQGFEKMNKELKRYIENQ